MGTLSDRGSRSRLLALASVAVLVLSAASAIAASGRRGTGLPPSIPGGGGGTDGGAGKEFVVDVKGPSGEALAEAISRVKPGGKLVLHAGPDGHGEYLVPKRLEIRKNIAIMAAKDDEGQIELVFPPSSRCLEIVPGLAGGTGKAEGQDEEVVGGPSTPPEYTDANMCKYPQDKSATNPTPKDTVALCGLRITRDLPDEGRGASGRLPACISVWRRKLYVEHTKIDAGAGPAIEAVNSPQVRMGTSEPGGIDRSVLIVGYGSYGIRIDRKSNLLLNWTEIAGFDEGAGVLAEGNIDLKRGVQIHDNGVGVMIGGGQDDADIFGPRNISIGVDQEVLEPASPEHELPLYKRPEIYDNQVGIRIGKNFDGSISVRSADIKCRLGTGCSGFVGIDVEPSKFSLHNREFETKGQLIAIKDTRIANQSVGIRTASPVRIGSNVRVDGNETGIQFLAPYDFERIEIDPYVVTDVELPRSNGRDEPIAIDFRGRVFTDLRLCNMRWPKLTKEWDRESGKRVMVGGVKLSAAAGARFDKCYVDDLRGLKKALWESSKEIFDQVCRDPIPSCG